MYAIYNKYSKIDLLSIFPTPHFFNHLSFWNITLYLIHISLLEPKADKL